MKRNSFAAFGVVTLLLSSLLIPCAVFSTQTLRGLILSLALVLIGFGLIFRRKWAALYFSLPLCVYGISAAYFSVHDVTFPLNRLAMAHGLSLSLPLVITIRVWQDLTWGRRFF